MTLLIYALKISQVLSEAEGENRIRNTCGAGQNVFLCLLGGVLRRVKEITSCHRLLYLHDVFIGRLALHRGRDVCDGAIHLYGDHFDRDGNGASGQNSSVDNFGVLQREKIDTVFKERREAESDFLCYFHQCQPGPHLNTFTITAPVSLPAPDQKSFLSS